MVSPSCPLSIQENQKRECPRLVFGGDRLESVPEGAAAEAQEEENLLPVQSSDRPPLVALFQPPQPPRGPHAPLRPNARPSSYGVSRGASSSASVNPGRSSSSSH